MLPAALLVLLCDSGAVFSEVDIFNESLAVKIAPRFQLNSQIDRRTAFGGARDSKTDFLVSNCDIE